MLRQYFRPLVTIAALAGLASYAIILIRGPQGIHAWTEKRREIRQLEEENANLQRDIEAKRIRIERLKNDPSTQQMELERLGLIRPNDTQFKIVGQHVTADPLSASPSDKPKQ